MPSPIWMPEPRISDSSADSSANEHAIASTGQGSCPSEGMHGPLRRYLRSLFPSASAPLNVAAECGGSCLSIHDSWGDGDSENDVDRKGYANSRRATANELSTSGKTKAGNGNSGQLSSSDNPSPKPTIVLSTAPQISVVPSSPPSNTPLPASTTNLSSLTQRSSTSLIAGGLVGGILALLLIGLALWWTRWRRLRKERNSSPRRVSSPVDQVGDIRSSTMLTADRPVPPAVIAVQAAMLEKANASTSSLVSGPSGTGSSSDSSPGRSTRRSAPATETQLRAVLERLALVESALTARDETGDELPPNYTPQ